MQLACFIFLLNFIEMLCFGVIKNVKKLELEGDWAEVRAKNVLAQTIPDKIFGTK